MKRNLLRAAAIVLLLLVCGRLAPSARASAEGNDLRAADAELNDTYRETLAALPDSETKSKLREAQRAWIAFRDAEIAVNGALSASGNELKMLQTDLTEARTKQLKALAEAAHPGSNNQ